MPQWLYMGNNNDYVGCGEYYSNTDFILQTNLLKKNEEEAKSSEIEGVCTIVYKNNVLHFTEFGNLTGVSKNPTISNLIWGHAYGRKADNGAGLTSPCMFRCYCFAFHLNYLYNVEC